MLALHDAARRALNGDAVLCRDGSRTTGPLRYLRRRNANEVRQGALSPGELDRRADGFNFGGGVVHGRNVSTINIVGKRDPASISRMSESPYLADVRRSGIKLIYAKRFAAKGGKAAFALAVKRSPSQVGHWFSGHRNPNGDTCREIERLLGLPRDWLDTPHEDIDESAAVVGEARPSVAEALPVVLDALRQAPDASRPELAQVLGLLVTTGSSLYAQRVAELLAIESGTATVAAPRVQHFEPAPTSSDLDEFIVVAKEYAAHLYEHGSDMTPADFILRLVEQREAMRKDALARTHAAAVDKVK